MTDKKISQLVNAATPLTGSELIPAVQSGANVKIAASNFMGAGPMGPTGDTGADGAVGPTGATGDLPGGGISDTKVFVDNSAQTHTVVISSGIITSWSVA